MTANKYKSTYYTIYNALPKWKQIAIDEDSKSNTWSGLLKEFVLKVIEESEKEFLEDKKASKYKTTKSKKTKIVT